MKNSKLGLQFRIRFKFVLLIFVALTCSLIAISCKSKLYLPTDEHVTSDASLQELQLGRELYVRKCNRCHVLYLPEEYNTKDWEDNLDYMRGKAKLKEVEYDLILKYLKKGRP